MDTGWVEGTLRLRASSLAGRGRLRIYLQAGVDARVLPPEPLAGAQACWTG